MFLRKKDIISTSSSDLARLLAEKVINLLQYAQKYQILGGGSMIGCSSNNSLVGVIRVAKPHPLS